MPVVYIFFTVYFMYTVKMNSGVLRQLFQNCGSYFVLANISKGGLWINKISSSSCSHNHGQNKLSAGAADCCFCPPRLCFRGQANNSWRPVIRNYFSKVYCKNIIKIYAHNTKKKKKRKIDFKIEVYV